MITKNQIKLIKSLSSKRNRVKHQLFVVEGRKNISELLHSDFEIQSLFATNEWINDNPNINSIMVSISELERISNQKTPNDVLAVVNIKNHLDLSDAGPVLVLDGISDPGNMGTIIRMCDWFGVKTIICSASTVDSYNPKVVQSSMGSIFRVAIIYKDLLEYLKVVKLPVYGAFIEGEDVKKTSLSKDFCLVIGNESIGISTGISKQITNRVAIKNSGTRTESLNVAVATSILLHEFCN